MQRARCAAANVCCTCREDFRRAVKASLSALGTPDRMQPLRYKPAWKCVLSSFSDRRAQRLRLDGYAAQLVPVQVVIGIFSWAYQSVPERSRKHCWIRWGVLFHYSSQPASRIYQNSRSFGNRLHRGARYGAATVQGRAGRSSNAAASPAEAAVRPAQAAQCVQTLSERSAAMSESVEHGVPGANVSVALQSGAGRPCRARIQGASSGFARPVQRAAPVAAV